MMCLAGRITIELSFQGEEVRVRLRRVSSSRTSRWQGLTFVLNSTRPSQVFEKQGAQKRRRAAAGKY
jgi:hypothetical protein